MAAAPLEDEIDRFLDKQDGLIKRERDPKMCRHNAASKCSFCLPIDPYDEAYLNQRDIKHMSFHAYLQKLTGGTRGRSTNMKYPLENIVCRVKPGCTTHPPWPEGICTKCHPNPVTLNRQRYRHVDNISFENQLLVNHFLDFWRRSGHQRMGYLIGRYEAHADVPLGIKCVISAIYEPKQTSSERGLQILGIDNDRESESREMKLLDEICQCLGLRRVGWVFTDLSPDSKDHRLMEYTRHKDSYFLSADECVTAGYLQSKHLNVCRYSSDGYFGSKFVTVVVTGGEDKQIHFSGYQVSNQCASLVRDNCLLPTKDAPELAWVRESTPSQCVPDVNFMEKDQYGNDVSKNGRPLPVEYLIVDVPCGLPLEQQFTFYADASKKPFNIENRNELGQFQNFDAACAYASQFTKNQLLELVSDLHFLLYLVTNDMCTFTVDELRPLLAAISRKDRAAACEWGEKNEHWGTMSQLMNAQGNDVGSDNFVASTNAATGSIDAKPSFACRHCTYLNSSDTGDCVLCGLPVAH